MHCNKNAQKDKRNIERYDKMIKYDMIKYDDTNIW